MSDQPIKKPESNYQNIILAQVKRDKTPVTIFLTNGVQTRGAVTLFDKYILLVDSEMGN